MSEVDFMPALIPYYLKGRGNREAKRGGTALTEL
jgi:hypothetical protein